MSLNRNEISNDSPSPLWIGETTALWTRKAWQVGEYDGTRREDGGRCVWELDVLQDGHNHERVGDEGENSHGATTGGAEQRQHLALALTESWKGQQFHARWGFRYPQAPARRAVRYSRSSMAVLMVWRISSSLSVNSARIASRAADE